MPGFALHADLNGPASALAEGGPIRTQFGLRRPQRQLRRIDAGNRLRCLALGRHIETERFAHRHRLRFRVRHRDAALDQADEIALGIRAAHRSVPQMPAVTVAMRTLTARLFWKRLKTPVVKRKAPRAIQRRH